MMLKTASKIVRAGGVIAYPTEAVWGLGCDPFNRQAVHKILTLKKRSILKGLIVIAADFAPVADVLSYLSGAQQQQILRAKYATFLVAHNGRIPEWISGGSNKFAVRFTKHLQAFELCKACGGLLVSTSANAHGEPPALSSLQVVDYFGDQIDFIYEGELGNYTTPSPIIDFASGKKIRA